MERIKLFSKCQHGLKKDCSIADAVLAICKQLIDNLDKKLSTCSIFLDLTKAYNTPLTIKYTIEKIGSTDIWNKESATTIIKQLFITKKQYTVIGYVK